MPEWWPAVVFGWPAVVVSVLLAAAGIVLRIPVLLLVSAVLAARFSYYLSGDVSYTIIAPVYFMDNLFFPHFLDGIGKGQFGQQLPADRKLQMIPLEDIGRFAALVIERCDRFLGKRINIASEDLDGRELVAVLSKMIGQRA